MHRSLVPEAPGRYLESSWKQMYRRWSIVRYKTDVMLQNFLEGPRQVNRSFPEVKPSRVAQGPWRRRGSSSLQVCGSPPCLPFQCARTSQQLPWTIYITSVQKHHIPFCIMIVVFYNQIILLYYYFVISAAPETYRPLPKKCQKVIILSSSMNKSARE